jgi:NADPH:quinone reductase-like Zn-dependent oxidoreductase
MRAAYADRYGPPAALAVREIDRPEPGEGEVLVRVRAAAVNPLDFHTLRGSPLPARMMMGGFGALRRPTNPLRGVDAAGVVESVGPGVTGLAPGDEVFGASLGSFAEFLLGRERSFVPKPERLTFEQAASLPVAGLTALQALRDKANVQPGQHVLITGASGGVGHLAVQIAKALGAEVTGVTSNVELVRSLGADHVVDYTQEDFTRNGVLYDVILDNVSHDSLRALRRALAPDGVLIPNGGGVGLRRILSRTLAAIVLDRATDQRFVMFISKLNRDDLIALAQLVDEGKVTPVIDRTYPLDEVGAALAYVEDEHARGKVVVTP